MNAGEVEDLQRRGYDPFEIYQRNEDLKEVIDFMAKGGIDGKNFESIVSYLLRKDTYMSLADFESFKVMQSTVNQTYMHKEVWNEKSLINIANSGVFSADRSIEEYVKKVWYR